MGKLRTFTRRAFLISSVAIAGGVAFGTYAYRKPVRNPLLDDLEEGEAALNHWVKIDADGITLITPRAEMGQGVTSLQATLLAEELDVDPHQVRTSPGKPSRAYYNSAVVSEDVAFPAYDESHAAENMRRFMDVPARFLGMQITGGSSTTPDSYVMLREAGAAARETLKEAAARRSGIPREQLHTEDAQVILPDGSRIPYTELAAEAAAIEPVHNVPLRPASEWKYLGKPQQRIDIVAKSTGTARYGIDVQVDDMLHAAVRTNPGIGGEMLGYDDSAARGRRGVQQIVPIRHGVAVIADNTWRAMQAVAAIDIEWGPAPYPADSEAMWQQLANTIEAEDIDNRNRDDGDVDTALASGEVLTAEYRVPYLAHAPLEPMNAIVRVTDDQVDIWTGTQIPGFVQQHVADMIGIDKDEVQVHAELIGGSFGRRLEDTYVLQATEIAMAVKGRAVKMTWSREEDMQHDYPRPMQLSRARGKADASGIDSYDLTIASQSVTASWFGRLMGISPGSDPSITNGAWDQPLAIPNYRVTGKRVPEMVPVSSWRSVGASGNGFLHGCFIDELCHHAGLDPLQELIRLTHHEPSRLVLEAVREMSGWDGPSMGAGRGRGVAFCLSFAVPVAEVVEVTRTEAGIRIDKVFAAVDVGQVLDPVNLEAQVSGGIIWGLGHAMNCELTYRNHAPEQTNFHAFEGMRLYQTPLIEVRALENGARIRGIGEPGVPPAAPALANAIFAATGQRIRELPLNKHIDFV